MTPIVNSLLDQIAAPTLYEYGYRRYRDPRYLAIINSPGERAYIASLRSSSPDRHLKVRSSRSLSMFQGGAVPPSFLYDLDPNEEPGKIEPVNVNYAPSDSAFPECRPPTGWGSRT